MVIQYPETVLDTSAIIMEFPMVDKATAEFYNTVKDGDRVRVDANAGTMGIL